MGIFNESCYEKTNLIHIPSSKARDLYYYVQWTGHFVCRKDFMIDRRDFDSYLLLHTITGSGTLLYEGQEYALTPGTTALIDCKLHHIYHPLDDGWEFTYIHLQGAESTRLYSCIRKRFSTCLIPTAIGIERYIDRVMSLVRDAGSEEICSALLYRIFMTLLDQPAGGTAGALDVSSIMTYIADNYHLDLSVSKLAALMHMSRTHFSGEFKRLTGYAPHRYLTIFRLSAAKQMLTSTALPVNEIAERCGFHEVSSFIRTFRTAEGVSPHQFRKQKR